MSNPLEKSINDLIHTTIGFQGYCEKVRNPNDKIHSLITLNAELEVCIEVLNELAKNSQFSLKNIVAGIENDRTNPQNVAHQVYHDLDEEKQNCRTRYAKVSEECTSKFGVKSYLIEQDKSVVVYGRAAQRTKSTESTSSSTEYCSKSDHNKLARYVTGKFSKLEEILEAMQKAHDDLQKTNKKLLRKYDELDDRIENCDTDVKIVLRRHEEIRELCKHHNANRIVELDDDGEYNPNIEELRGKIEGVSIKTPSRNASPVSSPRQKRRGFVSERYRD